MINLQVEKASISMEQVHTSGNQGTTDALHYEIQFQALAMNMEEDLLDNTNYYITAGVEYGHEAYIWIGQAEISTALVPHVCSL